MVEFPEADQLQRAGTDAEFDIAAEIEPQRAAGGEPAAEPEALEALLRLVEGDGAVRVGVEEHHVLLQRGGHRGAAPGQLACGDPLERRRGLPGDPDDTHSRYIEAEVNGMTIASIYLPNGNPVNKTSGLFSKTLRQLNPLLPVEESGRLNDPGLRENFIMRVYTYHRWQELNRQPLTAKALVQFHTRHKYLVMSHSHDAYKNLGQMVARAGDSDLAQLGPDYIRTLMDAIEKKLQAR